MSDFSSGTTTSLFGIDSVRGIRLTARPHAFAGAVLSPKHARELTPNLCMQIASTLSDQHSKTNIPYTVWITEAWRVLGWAEPSAALFWEMATMYHTLLIAGREGMSSAVIPPILSCGSTSSLGSGATNSVNGGDARQKKFNSVASAKELPVWLIGTFLLLHCEEFSYQRNLSGQDERRFQGGAQSDRNSASGRMDFTALFQNSALSPRTRLHAGWNTDNTHCAAYLLRHLRKLLLLTAISHNHEATHACMHLAAIQSPEQPARLRLSNNIGNKQYDSDDLSRQHDDEHGNVGSAVQLTMEDLDRLDLILQPQGGGGIDERPIRLGEFLWKSLFDEPPPPTASIVLGDAEREIRQHLEMEILMSGEDEKEDGSEDEDQAANALARLSINDDNTGDGVQKKQNDSLFKKELSYIRLRGTTIILKPNQADVSSGASTSSNEQANSSNNAGRMHDLVVSDCSDAHFYLLQPFEHATIAACTGCTIVVGAVAGLLHVVDCEKTTITSAARRILVSNSCDVKLFVFSPSPPLLVGDNRTCQFAPYNTYYDGLKEDLLATGLAASTVVPEGHSIGHSNKVTNEGDISWPPLQCASNKWKQPVDVSKLEVPQVPGTPTSGGPNTNAPLSPGADDRAMGSSGNDATMQAPVLVPASDFNVLFVPIESEAARLRRLESGDDGEIFTENTPEAEDQSSHSRHPRLLAEVLQLSPFRLPAEYERRVLMKAERMKNIQNAMKKNLTTEQQQRFEEELNRGFRDWLVTSGNLRQVLDLVHLEVKGP